MLFYNYILGNMQNVKIWSQMLPLGSSLSPPPPLQQLTFSMPHIKTTITAPKVSFHFVAIAIMLLLMLVKRLQLYPFIYQG